MRQSTPHPGNPASEPKLQALPPKLVSKSAASFNQTKLPGSSRFQPVV